MWSEVIGPFRFMPRGFLESSGNAVMGALVRGLLPPFMTRCGTVCSVQPDDEQASLNKRGRHVVKIDNSAFLVL